MVEALAQTIMETEVANEVCLRIFVMILV